MGKVRFLNGDAISTLSLRRLKETVAQVEGSGTYECWNLVVPGRNRKCG